MSVRPNFLFLFSDQHRGDWMPYREDIMREQGVAELRLNMPNIKGIMENGITFSCAYSPAPVCAPARACLAAGKRYKNCRVYWNNTNYDTTMPSFYNRLNEAGYFVCGTGKFDLNKGNLDWGDGYHRTLKEMGFSAATDSEGKMDAVWAGLLGEPGPYGSVLKENGLFDLYMEDMVGRGHSDKPTKLPDEFYADNWVAEKSRDMIAALPKDRPWFMQVNFSGPHDPWDITEKMKENIQGRSFPDAVDCTFTDQNQGVRQNYAAMIENIDRLCGEIIEAVRERGELDNTIIVYSSDHGEMMGDHDLYGKSKPEQGSIRIPMVIDAHHFGGAANGYNDTPVELQDLAMTFLDYAGVAHEDTLESMSLRPILDGETDHVREYAISELITPNPKGIINSFGTITDGRYKLIMKTGAADRLYDIKEDPFERKDLAGEHPEEITRLKTAFGERGQRRHPALEQYAKAFKVHG